MTDLERWLEALVSKRVLLADPYNRGLDDYFVRWDELAAVLASASPQPEEAIGPEHAQLLAWAVSNCHTLARRALAKSVSVYDREKWEHVLRICEKAGVRSKGVLRAALPTEITDGSASPQLDGWRPISTAPIEDRFLVCDGSRVMVMDGHIYSLSILPGTPTHLSGHHWTHWMPLPAQPALSPRTTEETS